MIMNVNVYVASAFSKDDMGGNRAGVVLAGPDLNEAEKTGIAYQLGYPETAFVSESGRADLKLEYFTPTGEVPLCGHATVGTFVVLRHLHMLDKPCYTIETKSGILRVTAGEDGLILMEQNAPRFYETLDKADLQRCLCPDIIADDMPVQIVSTGLKDILVPISSPAALGYMIPDFAEVSRLSREKDCVGVHAFSLMKEAGELTAVCRNFAPLYGINEESATGTSNCALACYLYQYGLRQSRYVFEQGHNLNSISRIYVHVEGDSHAVSGVRVGGYGYVDGRKNVEV